MPERCATPARRVPPGDVVGRATASKPGAPRIDAQRGVAGVDSGVNFGSGDEFLIWLRPCTRTPRFARGAELGRVSPLGESAYPPNGGYLIRKPTDGKSISLSG